MIGQCRAMLSSKFSLQACSLKIEDLRFEWDVEEARRWGGCWQNQKFSALWSIRCPNLPISQSLLWFKTHPLQEANIKGRPSLPMKSEPPHPTDKDSLGWDRLPRSTHCFAMKVIGGYRASSTYLSTFQKKALSKSYAIVPKSSTCRSVYFKLMTVLPSGRWHRERKEKQLNSIKERNNLLFMMSNAFTINPTSISLPLLWSPC